MARREYFAQGEPDGSQIEPSPAELFALGLKYCTGCDVEFDLVKAHKWFNLAALRGNRDARQYRSDIAQDMTHQEVFTAQRQAREWLQVH